MRGILFNALLLIIFSFTQVDGQDPDITISGNFRDLTFTEFAKQVELQTGAAFYFLEDWVKGIRVTLSGEDISLRHTLDRILLPTGLNYTWINSYRFI